MDDFAAAFTSPYVHFTAISGGLFLLILYIWIKRLRIYADEVHRKNNPPLPYDPRLLLMYRNGVILWGIPLVLTACLLALAFYLTRFQFLGSRAELLGEADVQHSSVIFHSTNYGDTYRIRGSQAAASGLILRFPAWTEILGLKNYHRFLGFRGNQETDFRYYTPQPQALAPYVDPFLLFLYKNQSWTHIQAKYQESSYFAGAHRKVFVTHSGYIIE